MTTTESLKVKEKNYRDRYYLLKKDHPDVKNFPPLSAFDPKTLPYLENGHVVYERALSINRSWAEEFWMEKTNMLTKEENADFQIAVIKPYNTRNGDRDFTGEFTKNIKKHPKGPYQLYEFNRSIHEHDSGGEYSKETQGMEKPKVAYIVASIVTDQDYRDVQAVASEYRRRGAKKIVLISPFFMNEREDKNVGKTKEGKTYYNGRVIKIREDMKHLSGLIDVIMVNERHSGAMDAFGAIYGIAVAPISLEEELIGQVNHNFLTKEERDMWELLSPDEGRTLVGERISEKIKKSPINLKQIRESKSGNKIILPLTENQKTRLENKNVMLYDDEGGTLKTIKNCVDVTLEAKIKSINIFLGHARLQRGWRKNLEYILKKCKDANVVMKIYTTNSRVPIGHLKEYADRHKKEIKIIKIDQKVDNMLEAAIAGINLWKDNDFKGVNWEKSITQKI